MPARVILRNAEITSDSFQARPRGFAPRMPRAAASAVTHWIGAYHCSPRRVNRNPICVIIAVAVQRPESMRLLACDHKRPRYFMASPWGPKNRRAIDRVGTAAYDAAELCNDAFPLACHSAGADLSQFQGEPF